MYKTVGIIIAIIIFGLPILLSMWLWYFHDRHIKKLNKQLQLIPKLINEKNRGRGIPASEQESQIRNALKPIEAELKEREYEREIFIQRAHLISIFKLK